MHVAHMCYVSRESERKVDGGSSPGQECEVCWDRLQIGGVCELLTMFSLPFM